MELVIAHLHHVRTLQIMVTGVPNDIAEQLNIPAPILERFALNYAQSCDNIAGNSLFRGDTPNLRVLRLSHTTPRMEDMSLSALQHLNITEPSRDLLGRDLSYSEDTVTNLDDYAIRRHGLDKVLLKHLQGLELVATLDRCALLLEQLDLPSLGVLNVSTYTQDGNPDHIAAIAQRIPLPDKIQALCIALPEYGSVTKILLFFPRYSPGCLFNTSANYKSWADSYPYLYGTSSARRYQMSPN
ncbi:uncharacterized protein B0H18DRAFT_1166301 [Fomitopsis serialis]|uniref:uncharacterized protein n=1 Tax=Fomitopsis serialis TaxID=139415 RepID=UPI00200738D2|nr:uncharacterized protein B0H18DRAFT_1166301 [Neoantrodia serialis]KAH9926381.1 hypothetical protein B0H18DRAFT_1166301 [Neoantrodia serialis]